MTNLDTSQSTPPCGTAQGDKARAAFIRWQRRSLGLQIAPRRPAVRLAPGTGVWVARPCAAIAFIPAHVSGWNDLTGTYYLIPDHDPHRPMFVSADRVIPRYVGEVMPGVVRLCP